MRGGVVHLCPSGAPRGNVLISYTTLPFLNTNPHILDGHTNRFECLAMVRAFLARGYAVDVIDFENARFVPQERYVYMLDVGANLERLAPLLPADCVKIFHVTTCHWSFNNAAEEKRLAELQKRRGVRLPPERMIKPHRGAESANLLLLLGNSHTESTYTHIGKPIYRISISSTFLYPFPDDKDFGAARKNFIWLGGAGSVHKGLDLLLEAFAEMSEYTLHICGKISQGAFENIYRRELYEMPNIKRCGVINLGGEEFRRLSSSSLAVLSPSCAEGQSGAVIVGMHAGLIPIVSKESGVDTDDYGVTLRENSIEEIKKTILHMAALSDDALRRMAKAAWAYARAHHTRERFSEEFGRFIDTLEKHHA